MPPNASWGVRNVSEEEGLLKMSDVILESKERATCFADATVVVFPTSHDSIEKVRAET